MKIIIRGKTDKKLLLVKFVKEITGLGLLESKHILGDMFNNFKDSVVLDIKDINYDDALNMFNEFGLSESGLTIHKHRKEIIEDLLNKPGLAKSSMAKSIARVMGYSYLDVRLSIADETDFGMPKLKVLEINGVKY